MDTSQKTNGLDLQMVKTPNIYCLVSGAAEGNTRLNAFDNALLEAGVGDTNLMRMSSICPPNAQQVNRDEITLPGGGLIPLAYAHIDSQTPQMWIASAIAIGIPEDPTQPGVIMEFEDHTRLEYVETIVKQMVVDAFEYRKRALKEIKFVGVEHQVKNCGSTFAAAVLWYK
ncbi:pyruvoyl-dependent arginine decarboxylase [Flavobacterium beibuense]|uniref:pyruvoyl-dependent arginine decarboxylase n=1 Tax=Flavobacterium beibuense TaxID=657326 RepID=UPI003A945C8A|tara:strand:+ start:11836 stop:12348 length:513 start_codon:yes stop_codon:yes gene_type:complete